MIHLPASVRVYLCLTACDMRKSFDGLHALVREHLELDAFAGHLFVFASRRKDRVKILYWDRDGFAVWSKRLEEGTYRGAVRCWRRRAPAGDHGARIRGTAKRNRPDASHQPQALSTVGLKQSCVILFLVASK
jgi:IS66 Orf2 like protein